MPPNMDPHDGPEHGDAGHGHVRQDAHASDNLPGGSTPATGSGRSSSSLRRSPWAMGSSPNAARAPTPASPLLANTVSSAVQVMMAAGMAIMFGTLLPQDEPDGTIPGPMRLTGKVVG